MKALNLGCGIDVRESDEGTEWVNLDWSPIDGVDVVHDLDTYPWPFVDGEFDAILAHDVWEHISDPLRWMQEVHRMLRDGGQVKIRTCQPDPDGFRDPTHRRWAVPETFDYWVAEPENFWHTKYPNYAGDALFRRVSVRQVGSNLEFVLEKLPKEDG